jgi:hypothetical protein
LKRLAHKEDRNKGLYYRQNRSIHKARNQLCMDLDDCRELARSIGGKASISSLSLQQRWELIEILKSKGARVYNPRLTEIRDSQRDMKEEDNPKDIYPAHLEYWNRRFPQRRPGYASNEQLAWISALWRLDFDDGRAGDSDTGLRRFIFRQTRSLPEGPVSDLAFLKAHHVAAVITPLKAKAREKHEECQQ